MLIRNIELKNKQLIISNKVIKFNEEGIGDIPDYELFEALLKIKGFTDAEAPSLAGKKINLQEVKSISIDELDSISDPEEPVIQEEEKKEKPKSKKKSR